MSTPTAEFFEYVTRLEAACTNMNLKFIELDSRCIALDIERRAYITEIESLEAKCQRLERELRISRELRES